MKLILCIHVNDISLQINCVFIWVGQERWLLAIYILHRLIMGKVEIDIFFCLNEDIWIFYRNSNSAVLYVSYDFCPISLNLIGCKGYIKVKKGHAVSPFLPPTSEPQK